MIVFAKKNRKPKKYSSKGVSTLLNTLEEHLDNYGYHVQTKIAKYVYLDKDELFFMKYYNDRSYRKVDTIPTEVATQIIKMIKDDY